MWKRAWTLGAVLATGTGLLAQDPLDLSPRDKTEVFIQHLVKVSGIDPGRYRALVLEYEIGVALGELAHDPENQDHPAEPGCCPSAAVLEIGDFIESALGEVQPEYGAARALQAEGKLEEARDAALRLAASSDPYLAAYASLLACEVEFELACGAGDAPLLEKVIDRAERIGRKDRPYLIPDHRACELIARAFGKLEKSLHEYIQYAILLTDYSYLPPDAQARARARLEELDGEAGRPIGTVANWMNRVEKLLGQEITGKEPTQAKQVEIVSALDKLIELQEARERKT